MNNAEYNSLGKSVAFLMANNSYSEIIWIILFSLSALFFFWILRSYSKNQNNTKEYIVYGSILLILTLGRLPHFSRGFIDGDESIWITNALTLIHDPRFYFSEIINSVRFFSVVPLLLLYPIGINHTTCQFIVILIFFLIILVICKILNLKFEKKKVFLSITPLVFSISLLNTFGFIPYNSEHFSILIILFLFYYIEKTIKANELSNRKLIIVGILSFIAINCKFQSLLLVIALNCYLFLNIKNKIHILFVPLGFLISQLPLVILAVYTETIQSIYYFWIDNFFYALFGLNDNYNESIFNQFFVIFTIPDTKYFYILSAPFFVISLFISLRNFTYIKELYFFLILLILTLYTVISPQFLFLHYIFYFIFIYFLSYAFLINIHLKNKNTNVFKFNFFLFSCLLPTVHILYSGNISFKIADEKLTYYESKNILLSLREQYLKKVSFPKFSILGWNNKYYTDGNFILGSSEMYTTLFENNFPSQQYRYHQYISNLEKRLPEIFCIQAGKEIIEYPKLLHILNINYSWVAKKDGNNFYILNKYIKI